MTSTYNNQMKQFTPNGFVITTQQPQDDVMLGSSYRGVAYGTPWPLEGLDVGELTPEDEKLTSQVQKVMMYQPYIGNSYPLTLVPDTQLVKRYCERCKSHKIAVRILLLATPLINPIIHKALVEKLNDLLVFLGFDYVSSDLAYSAVFDDLNPLFSPDVSDLASNLNTYGLFETVHALENYITARWEFVHLTGEQIQQADGFAVRVTPLEDSIDLTPCAVYEVKELI